MLEARGPREAMKRALETVPGVARVQVVHEEDEHATFEILAADPSDDLREPLAARVFQNGWALRTLERRRTTLEDRFIQAVTRQTVGGDDGAVAASGASTPDQEAQAALETV